MRLLLDTHLLLWAAFSRDRLSETARALILDRENELMFSVVSLWEIAIKAQLGRDDFRVDARLLRRSSLDNGYQELIVTGEHAVMIAQLPLLHRDPFDRLLIAQSIAEGVTLITADSIVARYPAPVRRV
ncbi:MAG TPA: type II toxin-antitoxin system VapC family toxin [Stellaceae bacterium]|nr:type II toxin-antitoxin system VapC family toxin [Stellaceae bacterium]